MKNIISFAAAAHRRDRKTLLPSQAFNRGLQRRARQDANETEGQKWYFLSPMTPDTWQGVARNVRMAKRRAMVLLTGYADTLGWRAVPGVRWVAEKINRPDIAETFEAHIRAILAEADAIDPEGIPAILARIRQCTADAVEELRQASPEARRELPARHVFLNPETARLWG